MPRSASSTTNAALPSPCTSTRKSISRSPPSRATTASWKCWTTAACAKPSSTNAPARHVNLIETLCDRLAARLLAQFPDVLQVKLRVSKPQAFADCSAVGVEISVSREDAA